MFDVVLVFAAELQIAVFEIFFEVLIVFLTRDEGPIKFNRLVIVEFDAVAFHEPVLVIAPGLQNSVLVVLMNPCAANLLVLVVIPRKLDLTVFPVGPDRAKSFSGQNFAFKNQILGQRVIDLYGLSLRVDLAFPKKSRIPNMGLVQRIKNLTIAL